MKTFITAFAILLIFSQITQSQDIVRDSTKSSVVLKPYHLNVIKFNPTPMLLFSEIKNITLSYERLIRDNQSVSFQAGYLSFDGILNDTVAGLIKFNSDKGQPGLNLSVDYRYYPSLRNRRPAPDGLYIGGYAAYYGLRFKNDFDILNTSLDQDNEINGKINVANLGFSLGYQFIFWKKLSLDLMVFGPSMQFTWSKGEVKGDLDPDDETAIDEELIERVTDRFPILGEVFSDENLSFSGNRTTFGTGFRYSFQIGYHF